MHYSSAATLDKRARTQRNTFPLPLLPSPTPPITTFLPNHPKIQEKKQAFQISLVDLAALARVAVCLSGVPRGLSVLLKVNVYHLQAHIPLVLVLAILLVIILIPLFAPVSVFDGQTFLVTIFRSVLELSRAYDFVLSIHLHLAVAPTPILQRAQRVKLDHRPPVLNKDEGADVPEPAAGRTGSRPGEVHQRLHDTRHEDVASECHEDKHVLFPEAVEQDGEGAVHHGEGRDHLVKGRNGEPRVLPPHGALEKEHLDVGAPRVAAPPEQLRAKLGARLELRGQRAHLKENQGGIIGEGSGGIIATVGL